MKLCLLGGFLGSGKTTAIATAGKLLLRKNVAFGAVVNDQGDQLVDSAFINSLNIPQKQVTNGCFCCRYDEFYSALQDVKHTVQADIIFAEAVGSCADLVATIVNPLLQFEPGIKIVLSVFADAGVLLSSIQERSSFTSESVQYLYKKQLEEADILVVNKSDTLVRDEILQIRSILETEFPGKILLFQNSLKEKSIEEWLEMIDNLTFDERSTINIDYEKYAAGEAALAWFDAQIVVRSKADAITKGLALMNSVYHAILDQPLPVGHLKFFLKSDNWQKKFSYTATSKPGDRELENNVSADQVSILINARVETDPDLLQQIILKAIKNSEGQNCHIDLLDVASFQPGYPTPTHRLAF